MPYSFTKIEKDKTNIVTYSSLFLIVFYFSMMLALVVILRMIISTWITIEAPNGIGPFEVKYHFNILTGNEMIVIFALSVFIAYFQMHVSTRNMVDKVLSLLKAQPLQLENKYHSQFRNILDELSAATGGARFEGFVMPIGAINAFALCDSDGRQIIGVTEGLLSTLNRAQVEGVAAQEAAHILKGDSLEATYLISLFNVHTEILRTLTMDEDNPFLYVIRSMPGFLAYCVFYIALFFSKTVGQLINLFVSRQREFRADAIAVRLTRDPLSLAEGLYLAAYHWKGSGLMMENLSAIFFVRPRYNRFVEADKTFPSLFSTHPSIEKRMSVLLDIAHSSIERLEETLYGGYFKILKQMEEENRKKDKWLVRKGNEWLGPFETDEFKALEGIHLGMFVKRLGTSSIVTIGAVDELNRMVNGKLEKLTLMCPRCYVEFMPCCYEGVSIHKCNTCHGVLVNSLDVEVILKKKDALFSEEIKHMAKVVLDENKWMKAISPFEMNSKYQLTCPKCRKYHDRMDRRFYSQQFKVEIDECRDCKVIWFDCHELEMLQYLFEKKG